MDPDSDSDPDPGSGSFYFVIDLQDASKKLFYNTIFSAYDFLKLHLHHFSKIKIQKESQNSRNQGFSYYFCVMIEGSRSGSRAGSESGSIPLTNGSGSGSWRPNMWIRIRYTAFEADLDPRLSILMPIQIRILAQVLCVLENQNFLSFNLYHCMRHCIYLSRQCQRDHIF